MSKKMKSLFFMVVLSFMLTGCMVSETKEAGKGEVTIKEREVTITYIAMADAAPQALINQKTGIFEQILEEQGIKVNWILTRSNDKVYPLMDKRETDFIYMPSQNAFTYVAANTEFGGSDNFSIVAGSLDNNSFILMAKDDINTLKDLDGKTVGIANHFYMEEFLLNKQLEKVGLKTESQGGTVKVEYLDWMEKIWNKFETGEYAAVTSWKSMQHIVEKKIPGSKMLLHLTEGLRPDGLVPQYAFMVQKDLVQKDPEIVKLVLKAHVMATEQALKQKSQLPELAGETWNRYNEEILGIKIGEYSQYEPEFLEAQWAESRPAYDPDFKYIKQVYEFMVNAGYYDKPIEDFVNEAILNEVLEEMGQSAINRN